MYSDSAIIFLKHNFILCTKTIICSFPCSSSYNDHDHDEDEEHERNQQQEDGGAGGPSTRRPGTSAISASRVLLQVPTTTTKRPASARWTRGGLLPSGVSPVVASGRLPPPPLLDDPEDDAVVESSLTAGSSSSTTGASVHLFC